MRVLRSFSVIAILFVSALVPPAVGQIDKIANSPVVRNLSIIRDEGWLLPVYDGTQIENAYQRSEQGTKFDFLSFRILKGNETQFDLFQFADSSTLKFSTVRVEARSITSVAFEGKVFLHLINYIQIGSYTTDAGVIHKAYVGPLIQIGYLDNDGDVKFETRYDASQPGIRVPRWIKK
jgi:hypothetical protein